MYRKTIVALLALMFAAPVYAASAQEQVNAKVLSYLRQGKIEALATYLSSLKECPRKNRLKRKDVPALCVKQKFSRNGQKETDYREISVVIEDINLSLPGATKITVTLNAVGIDDALWGGLDQLYREKFGNSNPHIFNKKNYVEFYNTYKNTWLKEDVLQLELRWIWDDDSFHHLERDSWEKPLYNSTELAMAIHLPIAKVCPVWSEWFAIDGGYAYTFIPGPHMSRPFWKYSVTQKNGRAVFQTFKTALRNYFFAPKRLFPVRKHDIAGTLASQSRVLWVIRYMWEDIMIGPVPQDMKENITKAIHKCYELMNRDEKELTIVRKYLEKEDCDKLKRLAIRDKVYIESEAEIKARIKAELKAELKAKAVANTKMRWPNPSQHWRR